MTLPLKRALIVPNERSSVKLYFNDTMEAGLTGMIMGGAPADESVILSQVSQQGTQWLGYAHYVSSAVRQVADQPQDCDLVVELTFMEDVGHWLAVDKLVGEYGEGKNCAEAVQDLVVSLFEDRDGLEERWDALSTEFRNKLTTLRQALRAEML